MESWFKTYLVNSSDRPKANGRFVSIGRLTSKKGLNKYSPNQTVVPAAGRQA